MKAFVKKAFVELLHTRSENRRLNNKVDYLMEENADLEKSNYRYQQDNNRLNKDLTDYRLLKKELGNDEVDRLLDKAKGIRRKERKHNYEQDFFR